MATANEVTTETLDDFDKRVVAGASQVFELLSDPTRLRIVLLLGKRGEMSVTAICEALGTTQPALSHHLALMRAGNILTSRREGKFDLYSVCRMQMSVPGAYSLSLGA